MNESNPYEHYSMLLEWDPRDHIYVVSVPELPGCHTHGKTYQEGARNRHEVIELWVDAARTWGDPIPPPKLFHIDDIEETEQPQQTEYADRNAS